MKLQVTNRFIIPKNYKLKANRGFTLVESLVAITILIIGVMGPMMAATRGITDGLYAQNQLIATHLAQEGLDLLNTQIENNSRAFTDFLAGLSVCLDSLGCAGEVGSSGFSVDLVFFDCTISSDCNIAFDTVNPELSFYKRIKDCTGCNFVGPIFTRTLTVDTMGVNPSTATEVLLKSTVTWTNKSSPQSIVLYRYAFNQN